MLVLSRRVGESVVIGEDIFITVLGFKGNQVSLGFNAPNSLPVNRHEIDERIQNDKKDGYQAKEKLCPAMV